MNSKLLLFGVAALFLVFGLGSASACYNCYDYSYTSYSKTNDYYGGSNTYYAKTTPYSHVEKSKTVVKSQPYYYRGNYGHSYKPNVYSFGYKYPGSYAGYSNHYYPTYNIHYPTYRINYGHGTYGQVPYNRADTYWRYGYQAPIQVQGYVYKSYY
jgi:hypothetical protein